MGTAFLLKGLILGFSIAAPVGPIGVLCIRRTLSRGMLNGFLSGIGAATADGIYGCIAAFGVTAVSSLLLEHQFYLRLAGGVFLLYLGLTRGADRSPPPLQDSCLDEDRWGCAYRRDALSRSIHLPCHV